MSAANPYLRDLAVALECAEAIEKRADLVRDVLCRYETLETADDEIVRSLDTLRNLHRELHYLRIGTVDTISVFLPINLPLYSLVLFACVPSLMSHSVTVRGPAATPEWVDEVAEAAQIKEFFPRVHLVSQTRRQFLEGHVHGADAVVFTGRYENAEAVRGETPGSTFIYEGSGINPIVIGPDAELSEAVMEQVMAARLFNSGQDCAGPDVVCVHRSRLNEFLERLTTALANTPIGELGDRGARVTKILNRQPLKDVAAQLIALHPHVVYGGTVDVDSQVVAPTIVVRDLGSIEPFEWFSPVFNIGTYGDLAELREWFGRPAYCDYAMYVSLFGEAAFPELFATSTVLQNRTILDVEQGNTAYGGNGPKANYVIHGDDVRIGPILISESLASTRVHH